MSNRCIGTPSMWDCRLTTEIIEKIRAIGKEQFLSRSIALVNRIAELILEVKEETRQWAIKEERMKDWERTYEMYGAIYLEAFPTAPLPWYSIPFDFSDLFDPVFPLTIYAKVDDKEGCKGCPVVIFFPVLNLVIQKLTDEEWEMLQLILYRQLLVEMVPEYKRPGRILAEAEVDVEKFELF